MTHTNEAIVIMHTKEQIVKMDTDEVYGIFGGKNKLGSTSAAIRYLLALKLTRSEVSKKLEIRYQHVRNVQLQELKKGPAIAEPTDDGQMKFDF